MRSFIEPIQSDDEADEGGVTAAIGSPKRVTVVGLFDFRTWSSRARHFALNSETGIVFIGRKVSWSTHFVTGNPAAFQALKPPAMERTFL